MLRDDRCADGHLATTRRILGELLYVLRSDPTDLLSDAGGLPRLGEAGPDSRANGLAGKPRASGNRLLADAADCEVLDRVNLRRIHGHSDRPRFLE
jgi:hypothetical protein